MKSKIADKIGKETPKELSNKVRTDTNLFLSGVRQSALDWWHLMTFEEQFYKTIEWLSNENRDTTERHPHHLTGREIQQIYEMVHSA